MQIEAQKIIDAVINQRNEALNKLAYITAYSKQLEDRIKAMEQQAAKNNQHEAENEPGNHL